MDSIIRMKINITHNEQVEWLQLCARRGESSADFLGSFIRTEILINKNTKPFEGYQFGLEFGE